MPIKISSKIPGFRRCGMAHPTGPVEHADGTFSEDEIKRLQEEPRLEVEIIEATETESASGDDSRGLDATDVDASVDNSLLPPLESLTVAELKDVAKAGDVDGYKSMNKSQLIEAIKAKQAEGAE